jgi:hypothetical protein
LTTEERDALHEEPAVGVDQSGLGPGRVAPHPVSGGSHAHDAAADHGHAPATDVATHGGYEVWPDLTKKEAITLIPLAILTIVTGVYPAPIFDIVEPAFERILAPFT